MKICFRMIVLFLILVAQTALLPTAGRTPRGVPPSALFAAVPQAAAPQQAHRPLTKGQVMDLVKFGLNSTELARKIQEYGIDFEPTDDYLAALRKAGAKEAVIQALRESKPHPLTREQLGKLVAAGVPSERVTMLVKQHGIVFLPDEQYLQTLRMAGADDALLAALRQAGATMLRVNPKDGLKYVWIPAGTFVMGCSPGDKQCFNVEKPAHRVTITRGFWIGQTEITVGAYKRFAAATGRKMPDAPTFNRGWTDEKMPIVNLSWNDAHDYCVWAGGRLPTEAEWEYAARAGSSKARYGALDDIAWYSGNSGGQAHDVAQKRPNAFGLFDTLGNAFEWVNDYHQIVGKNYYSYSPEFDPQGEATGNCRLMMGGSWNDGTRNVRVSAPNWNAPDFPYHWAGSRCLLETVPSASTAAGAVSK